MTPAKKEAAVGGRNKSGMKQKVLWSVVVRARERAHGQVDAQSRRRTERRAQSEPSWVASHQHHRTSQSAPGCRPYRLSFFPYRNAAMCRFRFIFYSRPLQRRDIMFSL